MNLQTTNGGILNLPLEVNTVLRDICLLRRRAVLMILSVLLKVSFKTVCLFTLGLNLLLIFGKHHRLKNCKEKMCSEQLD